MKQLKRYMLDCLCLLGLFIRLRIMPEKKKDLRIIALEAQVALMQADIIMGKVAKPRSTPAFRQLWVLLSERYPGWRDSLVFFKPETVIRWHKSAFKCFWRRKSKTGRPKISMKTIWFIKKMHRENPALSPEKIHDRLLGLNIADVPAPNSIAKYIKTKPVRKPPSQRQRQSWQVFLTNQAKGIWAMDFAVVPTVLFRPLYVLFMISHDRRKIEHFAVTESPNEHWMVQQIRNATPYEKAPKYLIHDNGSVFKSAFFQRFLVTCGIKSKCIMPKSPWQNGICERLIGIVRRELFDYIIPFNENHLWRLLAEYVDYYNHERPHRFLDGGTPVVGERPPLRLVEDAVLEGRPVLGGLYHLYDKGA